jgi:hypothetical protein
MQVTKRILAQRKRAFPAALRIIANADSSFHHHDFFIL